MDYRRAFIPGGSFFFTVVTEGRRPLFRQSSSVVVLRRAFESVKTVRPFRMDGVTRVLELGCGCGAISRYLGEQPGVEVDAVEGIVGHVSAIIVGKGFVIAHDANRIGINTPEVVVVILCRGASGRAAIIPGLLTEFRLVSIGIVT